MRGLELFVLGKGVIFFVGCNPLQDVSRMGANNAAWEAVHVWEIFPSYFFKEGAVPWQHHRLHYAQPNALLRAIDIEIRVFFC